VHQTLSVKFVASRVKLFMLMVLREYFARYMLDRLLSFRPLRLGVQEHMSIFHRQQRDVIRYVGLIGREVNKVG
jgi:hypothetical protein